MVLSLLKALTMWVKERDDKKATPHGAAFLSLNRLEVPLRDERPQPKSSCSSFFAISFLLRCRAPAGGSPLLAGPAVPRTPGLSGRSRAASRVRPVEAAPQLQPGPGARATGLTIPSRSPIEDRTSLISFRLFRPKFGVRSIAVDP